MTEMGVVVEKHHHEVASAQHELGVKFGPMIQMADHMQIYKYVVHNVAQAYGKTATFMPKPIFGDNGSGMHVHQSIWKGGQPMFAGNKYADLSDMCLYYIGGILKHAKAINAFTNPLTNSYKRLVPGYEAPVLLAYSARNRSASCRIPVVTSPKAKRIEIRFPDPGANPYLAFAAMLMAGLDGIQNKIHPGEPMDKNLYDLPPAELAKIPTVCGSLREALSQPRQGPRVPEGRRRHERRHDRRLHRAAHGREHALRDDAASDRVRHVLLGLMRSCPTSGQTWAKARDTMSDRRSDTAQDRCLTGGQTSWNLKTRCLTRGQAPHRLVSDLRVRHLGTQNAMSDQRSGTVKGPGSLPGLFYLAGPIPSHDNLIVPAAVVTMMAMMTMAPRQALPAADPAAGAREAMVPAPPPKMMIAVMARATAVVLAMMTAATTSLGRAGSARDEHTGQQGPEGQRRDKVTCFHEAVLHFHANIQVMISGKRGLRIDHHATEIGEPAVTSP